MPARINAALIAMTVAASLVVAPVTGLAQAGVPTPAAGFCGRFTTVNSRVTQQLTDLEAKRAKKRSEIEAKLKERRDARLTRVARHRTEAEQKLDERLAELEAQAATDAQKQAIADFKATVTSAQQTRRTAVDAARETFRTAHEQAVATRHDGMRTAVATFKSSVDAAVTKAKTDCDAGVTPATARQTFTASVKTAKDKLRSYIQALDKIGPQVEALAKTRNDAVRAANQTFKTTLEQAQATLKAAFP